MRGGNKLTTSDSGRVVRGENLCFLCLCVGLLFWWGWSEVLISIQGMYGYKSFFPVFSVIANSAR